MKKLLRNFIVGAMALVMIMTSVVVAHANNDIAVTIDGVAVEFPNARPALVDGRVLVPIRAVFEHLGFEVGWDAPTQTATITRGDDTIIITIGNATFYTNGIAHAFDVPAQIINGSTMVPIRLPLESVGFYVGWTDNSVIVSVEPIEGQTVVVPPLGDIPAYIYVPVGQGSGLPFGTLERISTSVEEFNADGRFRFTIEQFEQLRYLQNLTHLTITNIHFGTGVMRPDADWIEITEPFNDLSLLAGLTNLTHLELRNGQFTDITPLAGLTNLTYLHMGHLPLTDLTPLAGLTNLTHLDMTNLRNAPDDLTPLAGLTNLSWLTLNGGQFTDITPLAGLTNLDNLSLINNQITDLTPLVGLTNLGQLMLGSNQITDITPLAGLLTNLWSLSLAHNQITDISALAGFDSSAWLDLRYNQITDGSPVAHVEVVLGRP